ncbi:immunoglobulin-like domain-containing protein [Bacillus toyonensis]|uniref:immunoglobulin-like domain-containing protein n=1 Tax=Bacillus toyonensis TaxID=155322 RepID=UPI000BF8C3EC|nr:immunoglobulin-like domain-containing protein [Bacillus toyonensis]PGF05058.1 cell surface protein [Bacillus toyonensis]
MLNKKLMVAVGSTVILGLGIFGYKTYAKAPEIMTNEITIDYGKKLGTDKIKTSDDVVRKQYKSATDTNKLGKQTIKVEVENDKGVTTEKDITLNVVDKEKPVIKTTQDKFVTKKGHSINLKQFVTAKDNVDGDLTNKILIQKFDYSKVGDIKVSMGVADSSDNFTEKTVIVSVVDEMSEVLTVPESRFVRTGDDFKPIDGVEAKDYNGTDLTSKININGKVDTSKAGEYSLTYQVTDSQGIFHQKSGLVVVKDEVVEKAIRDEQKYKEENSVGDFVRPEKPETAKLLEDIADDKRKQGKKSIKDRAYDTVDKEKAAQTEKDLKDKVNDTTDSIKKEYDEHVKEHRKELGIDE